MEQRHAAGGEPDWSIVVIHVACVKRSSVRAVLTYTAPSILGGRTASIRPGFSGTAQDACRWSVARTTASADSLSASCAATKRACAWRPGQSSGSSSAGRSGSRKGKWR